jgi:predicted transcriptional regulator
MPELFADLLDLANELQLQEIQVAEAAHQMVEALPTFRLPKFVATGLVFFMLLDGAFSSHFVTLSTLAVETPRAFLY